MNKKRFAKEWLYLLSFSFFGFLMLPFLLTVLFVGSGQSFSTAISEFYSALVNKRDWLIPWLIGMGPYLLFQLVRSVMWAWKTARKPE